MLARLLSLILAIVFGSLGVAFTVVGLTAVSVVPGFQLTDGATIDVLYDPANFEPAGGLENVTSRLAL